MDKINELTTKYEYLTSKWKEAEYVYNAVTSLSYAYPLTYQPAISYLRTGKIQISHEMSTVLDELKEEKHKKFTQDLEPVRELYEKAKEAKKTADIMKKERYNTDNYKKPANITCPCVLMCDITKKLCAIGKNHGLKETKIVGWSAEIESRMADQCIRFFMENEQYEKINISAFFYGMETLQVSYSGSMVERGCKLCGNILSSVPDDGR